MGFLVCEMSQGEISGTIINQLNKYILKKIIILLLSVALYSCSDESGKKEVLIFKAKCLESNTKTYARFPSDLSSIYSEGDTVFVNMHTHFIDDRDTTAQLCILIR